MKMEKPLDRPLPLKMSGSPATLKNEKQLVRSLCPKCGRFHFVAMWWTGRGVPRKYCRSCRFLTTLYDHSLPHDTEVNTSLYKKARKNL